MFLVIERVLCVDKDADGWGLVCGGWCDDAHTPHTHNRNKDWHFDDEMRNKMQIPKDPFAFLALLFHIEARHPAYHHKQGHHHLLAKMCRVWQGCFRLRASTTEFTESQSSNSLLHSWRFCRYFPQIKTPLPSPSIQHTHTHTNTQYRLYTPLPLYRPPISLSCKP